MQTLREENMKLNEFLKGEIQKIKTLEKELIRKDETAQLMQERIGELVVSIDSERKDKLKLKETVKLFEETK